MVVLIVLTVCVSLGSATVVSADPLTSAHYKFQETSLGGSGLTFSQSANYRSSQSTGVLGIGNSASASFQTYAGNITTSDPTLSFAINTTTVSFGSFSPGAAAVSTAAFQVIDYTSYGYIVQVIGNPPVSSSGHTISAMTSTGPSQAGIEQFGINLVANTSPVSLGSNPDHGQYGFGSATSNYGTSNNYRFVSGETIASAPKSSGETIYTISYIINVNSLTPSGQYTGSQTIVCTGTY